MTGFLLVFLAIVVSLKENGRPGASVSDEFIHFRALLCSFFGEIPSTVPRLTALPLEIGVPALVRIGAAGYAGRERRKALFLDREDLLGPFSRDNHRTPSDSVAELHLLLELTQIAAYQA